MKDHNLIVKPVFFEDMKYCFELQPRDHPSMTLMCKTAEEKNNWMAALVSLLTRRQNIICSVEK